MKKIRNGTERHGGAWTGGHGLIDTTGPSTQWARTHGLSFSPPCAQRQTRQHESPSRVCVSEISIRVLLVFPSQQGTDGTRTQTDHDCTFSRIFRYNAVCNITK